MMEGEGSDGGTDEGEESGGAGLSFLPQAVVFVHKPSFAFVGGCSHWWAVVFVCGQGVVSWVLVIPASGSLSSVWSFVVMVTVLGAGLLFVGVIVVHVVVCGCGYCTWGWVIVCGRRIVVGGAHSQVVTSFMAGG